jgi:hypothetical protein
MVFCEISAGRGGEGAGRGRTFTARDEMLFCWMCVNAVCEIEWERSCEWPKGLLSGAKVGVLTVVRSMVAEEPLG